MAKLRSGADMIDDAYRRADVEGDTDRHPRPEVLAALNLGHAERYDLMVSMRGKSFFRASSPWTFSTALATTHYTAGFPVAFYQLISVRVARSDGHQSTLLEQAPELEEGSLFDARTTCWPTHYDLRPGGIEILPRHEANLLVTVDYIPVSTDIVDSADMVVDGVDGWEEYEVLFAAKRIALKDEEYQLLGELDGEMKKIAARITSLTPKRDNFRPRRVQDVRGARMFGQMQGRGPGWRGR